MLAHVRGIERAFLAAIDRVSGPLNSRTLLLPDEARRGRFLAFRTKDAGSIAESLLKKKAIVDHRGDRLRVGFGIYHDERDVERLVELLSAS
jgi:selenocysteine lyase/cysteine desulfurase